MAELKQLIRSRIKQQRLGLPQAQVAALSRRIAERCESDIDWAKVTSLQTFLPIGGQNEVDTFAILDFVWRQYPEVRTYAAVMAGEAIVSAPISRGTSYRAGRFSLMIPEDFSPDTPDTIKPELILVPLLAFDRSCHRIGYGKGHYDRYLTQHLSAVKVGLSFEMGLIDEHFAADHDVALDAVITESATYHSSSGRRRGIVNT